MPRSFCVLSWCFVCVIACAPDPSLHTPSDAALLKEVLDSYWDFVFENEIEHRMKYGAEIERLPDMSLAEARQRSDVARRHMERLQGVRAEALEHRDWVAHEVLRWDLRLEAERARHYWLNISITPRMVRNTWIPEVFQGWAFEEPAHLDGYLDLLSQLPSFADTNFDKVRGQVERGIVLPRAEMDLLLPIWRSLARPGATSPFYVSEERVAGLAATHAAQVADFRDHMRQLVDTEIVPSFAAFLEYLEGEYSDNTLDTVGFGQYPGGADYYDFMARYFATVDVAPQDIHRMGLEQVAALTAEMEEYRRSLDFEGRRDDFHRFLKSDPRFLAKTPEEVGERLRACLARLEPRLGEYFSRLPAAPYDVKRLPERYEGGMTFGFYRPPEGQERTGYYLFNGSNLGERTLYAAAQLIYHELVPGHHLQANLQWENEDLHVYLQNAFYSAYSEGWAVYASQLPREMGLLDDDPYGLYGMLAVDRRFATRLVLDTGLNVLGWSHQQGIDYMRQNTLLSDDSILSETLRYAADAPGQALAYKIGADKIWELRRRAEAALGGRFDVRRFHDAVLDYGTMPLAVLEAHIDRFIEGEAAR